jgi:RimJ/RimL family protein N-acetyltransferase
MAQLSVPRYTPRLTLRAFTIGDLDDLAELYGLEEVCRYLYWGVRDRDASLAAIERSIARPVELGEHNVLPVAVVETSSQRVVGDFMLRWTANEHRQGEVGGALHPDVHGRGVAGEIYAELLDLAFNVYDLHRVIGRCEARNTASIRSLEKAGLRVEGHFVENEFVKGEWTSEVVLALRASEWRARS